MTILITGTTGLVGARLLPRLVAAGFDCRALVRPGKPAPVGAETAQGDLLDPSSLPAAVAGVSAVIHLAAVFRTADSELIWKSNLEGTRNLIAAVKAHAPAARFILSSTSNVYDADAPRPSREDDASSPRSPIRPASSPPRPSSGPAASPLPSSASASSTAMATATSNPWRALPRRPAFTPPSG